MGTLQLDILLLFVSSSSIGRRYPRRRSLLCFLLFILLVASTAGLVVRVVMFCIYRLTFFVIFKIYFGSSGGHVEAGQRLQRDLRYVGAGDVAGFVHHGTNYLLELSENQQSYKQYHIDRE